MRALAAAAFLSACQHKVVAYGEIDRDVVADLVAEVARIRGIAPTRPIRVKLQRARELRAVVDHDLADDVTSGALARRSRAWAKVGLVPWGFDLGAWQRRTYSEEPAGYYATDERRLYVVDRPAFRSDIGEIWGAIVGRDPSYGEALAHEVAHAIVDQRFDLEALIAGDVRTDEELARRALAEGDATKVGFEWSGGGDFGDHVGTLEQRMQAISDPQTPEWLRLRLSLPYVAGARIVERLHARGRWRAVNRAYADPPASSEQLLHPERYPSDRPAKVSIPAEPLGDASGRRLLDDTIGELGMRCVLRRSLPRGRADAAATGWDGDAVGVWDSEHLLLVWRSAWDSEAEAAEWERAYVEAVAEGYVRRRAWARGPGTTVFATDQGLVGVERCGADVLVYEGVPEEAIEDFREEVRRAQDWPCEGLLRG